MVRFANFLGRSPELVPEPFSPCKYFTKPPLKVPELILDSFPKKFANLAFPVWFAGTTPAEETSRRVCHHVLLALHLRDEASGVLAPKQAAPKSPAAKSPAKSPSKGVPAVRVGCCMLELGMDNQVHFFLRATSECRFSSLNFAKGFRHIFGENRLEIDSNLHSSRQHIGKNALRSLCFTVKIPRMYT